MNAYRWLRRTASGLERRGTPMGAVEVVEADITTLAVDAIVNGANETLRGGSGVDGAIHRAAGPRLLEACRRFDGCPTGEVRLTAGFDLPATWVIHTVGPVWRSGEHGEDDLLARCYRNALWLCSAIGARSVAFPAISTGVYGFPAERAAAIAARETLAYARAHPEIHRVLLVGRGGQAVDTLRDAIASAT
jgi:O-acetyl-ADP-ribose deacetylase